MSIVPHKGGRASQADNTARRVWDKEEFRQKAEEREKNENRGRKDKDGEGEGDGKWEARKRKRLQNDPLHQGLIVARTDLKQRDFQIDLASRLGKTQVVGINTPLSQQAGFYCGVCDCILRDNMSYLDHINGKWHNRALGMTMRVEKSTVDQVKKKLEEVKQKKAAGNPDDYLPDGIDRRILEAQEAEEREKEERKEKKREKKQREKDEAEAVLTSDADPAMMALMGFGGFGGSKK